MEEATAQKLHKLNPIIRGALRKTVINVLSIQTFISCQNDCRREKIKRKWKNSRAETSRQSNMKMHSAEIMSYSLSHEFI